MATKETEKKTAGNTEEKVELTDLFDEACPETIAEFENGKGDDADE
jgi:hypothetical protein